MVRITLALFIMLMGTSCNELRPEKEAVVPLATKSPVAKAGHQSKPTSQPATKLSEEDSKLIVATIGERVITLGELERQLEEQPVYVRVRYNTLEKKKEFLDNVIRFELLAQEAIKRGYDKDPEVVFAMKQQMIKMLMAKDMESLVSMQDISEEDVARFYEENKQIYFKPEASRISAIVLNSKKKADTVLAKLKSDFEAEPRKRRQLFTSAVDQYTTDPMGRAKRGDLGFFTAEGKDPDTLKMLENPPAKEVREAAFKLEKINALSPVVSVGEQHHIVLLTNRRPEVSKSLSEVKRQIRNKLFRDEKDDARDRFIADLRTKADVKVHEDKLALLRDRAAKAELPGFKEVQRLKKDAAAKGLLEEPSPAKKDGSQ